METTEKVFCGNAKIITTKYGDLTKISFSKDDLEKLVNNLENGWVNTVLKEKKTKVEGKPTHYLEVDFWKPMETTTQENANVAGEPNDLPF